jgi:2-succinyl-5-enolpyruvyl-6-hydroxy-3-cyclohexene-1-carboxylate synthase
VNPSTALATVLVDELMRSGVRDAVLSPGSRNAPLAFALHAADAAGRLRLHVRIDERTAGFLALGLAKVSGAPVPVVTTSGTAAANLHPAVVEASHAGVPLIALTADRPPELRGTGANQAIDQLKIYGSAVRLFHDLGTPERRPGQNAPWRALVARTVAAATGVLSEDPGPVHLNVPLREPLVPQGDAAWPESLDGRPGSAPWVSVGAGLAPREIPYDGDARTLVIVGDAPAPLAHSAAQLARARGWPIVTEPMAPGVNDGAPMSLLGVPGFLDAWRPERVLVVGRPTLSRTVGALVRDPRVAVDVIGSPRWADPAHAARWVGTGVLAVTEAGPTGDEDFREAWLMAGGEAVKAAEAFVAAEPWPTGLHVARAVCEALPPDALLVAGSSSPVRYLDTIGAPWQAAVAVVANRGAAGIDGTVSTAIGAALAHQRDGGGHAYAVMGDLTFLHDATGLLAGPHEPRPDLCIVVVNDDGGSIFGLLEQGAPEHAGAFERVFGTPVGADLAALCAASGTPHRLADSPEALEEALHRADGLRVVEVRVDRRRARDFNARLHAAVAAAVSGR